MKTEAPPTFDIIILDGGVRTLDGLLHNRLQIANTAHVRHEQMFNDRYSCGSEHKNKTERLGFNPRLSGYPDEPNIWSAD